MSGKKREGFLEGLLKDMTSKAIIEASRDRKGRIDPYKAAGIAYGSGHFDSFENQLRFAGMLGAHGAFDGKNTSDHACSYSDDDDDFSDS